MGGPGRWQWGGYAEIPKKKLSSAQVCFCSDPFVSLNCRGICLFLAPGPPPSFQSPPSPPVAIYALACSLPFWRVGWLWGSTKIVPKKCLCPFLFTTPPKHSWEPRREYFGSQNSIWVRRLCRIQLGFGEIFKPRSFFSVLISSPFLVRILHENGFLTTQPVFIFSICLTEQKGASTSSDVCRRPPSGSARGE